MACVHHPVALCRGLHYDWAFFVRHRQLEVLKRKAEDALAEAEALEGTEEARLKEQGEWNVTFAESQQVRWLNVCRAVLCVEVGLLHGSRRFSLVFFRGPGKGGLGTAGAGSVYPIATLK